MVQRDSFQTKPKKTNKSEKVVQVYQENFSFVRLPPGPVLTAFLASETSKFPTKDTLFLDLKKALYANKGLVEKLGKQTIQYCLLKSFNAHLKTS